MEEAGRMIMKKCLAMQEIQALFGRRKKFVSFSDDKLFHKAVDFLKSNPVNPKFAAAVAAARRSYWVNPGSPKGRVSLKKKEPTKKITSDMIQTYVVKIPDLKVEDVVSNFKNMHKKLDMTPSSAAYEKLIIYCCDSHEVREAFDLLDEMIDLGLSFSFDTLQYVLKASSEIFSDYLAYRTYSVMSRCNLKPNSGTFRIMLEHCVKVQNFDGAFSLLCYLEENNMFPTAAMYYAVMRRHYREPLFLVENLGEMNEADIELDEKTREYQQNNTLDLEILGDMVEASLEPDDDQTCDDQKNMSCQLENLEEKKEADIKLDDDQTCHGQESMSRQLENLEEKKEADIKLDDETLSGILEILEESDIEPEDWSQESSEESEIEPENRSQESSEESDIELDEQTCGPSISQLLGRGY